MVNRWIGILLLIAMSAYAQTDPTMPANWRDNITLAAPKDITLSGIITTAHRQTAVLNGKSLQVGDFVEGYEITKIDSHAVYLKNNRGTFMIPLTVAVTTPITDENQGTQGSR